MTFVRMQKHNKYLLKDYGDGSYDDIINTLIDDVEESLPVMDNIESIYTTMRLNEDTIKRLDELKLVNSETYECIILRMLLLAKDLNTNEV